MKKDLSADKTKIVNHLQYQNLTIVATIIITGLALSVFYHYSMATFMHRGFPFSTFLFLPQDQFMDFFNSYRHITLTGKGVYAPGHDMLNFIYYLLPLFSFKTEGLSYLIYALIFTVYLFCFNYFNIKKNKEVGTKDWSLFNYSFIFTFLTYPFLFAIDRGNCEMYIFITLSLSFFFYYQKKYLISAILLGLAVHFKIYFAVFLLIYFTDKRFREIGIVIFLFFILPYIALFIDNLLFPAVQFSDSIFSFLKSASSSENWYNTLYVLGDGGAAYCSSLYGGLKGILYFIHPDMPPGSAPIQHLFRLYFPVSALCAGIITVYMLFFEREAWKKVTLVTLALILLPYVTGDYRLIMLLIPLWMFINSQEQAKNNVLYAILFGLLLIPKDYYIIRSFISISVIINPILIIIFMILLISEGIKIWAEKNPEKFRKIRLYALYVFLGSILLTVLWILRG